MASLVEELVGIIDKEEVIYKRLDEYAKQKKDILIKGDVAALENLTVLEQTASDELLVLSNKQSSTLKDIATVMGIPFEEITVTKLIGYLDKQPDIQLKLTESRNQLLKTAKEMQLQNQQNEALLKQAIEMSEFEITLFKSMRQAPETANYNRNAYNTGSILGSSGFDAKQ